MYQGEEHGAITGSTYERIASAACRGSGYYEGEELPSLALNVAPLRPTVVHAHIEGSADVGGERFGNLGLIGQRRGHLMQPPDLRVIALIGCAI